MPLDLMKFIHICIRNDDVCALFRPLYDGPFLVIDKKYKFFRIQKDSRETVVLVDRLKQAFILIEDLPITATIGDQKETEAQIKEPTHPSVFPRCEGSIRRPVRFSYHVASKGILKYLQTIFE